MDPSFDVELLDDLINELIYVIKLIQKATFSCLFLSVYGGMCEQKSYLKSRGKAADVGCSLSYLKEVDMIQLYITHKYHIRQYNDI